MVSTDELVVLSIDISALSRRALKHFEKRDSLAFPNEHTFVHYLERIEANTQAIHHIIDKLSNNSNMETSIGILLRANLSDYFNLGYITIGKFLSDKEWFDRICIVNFDQIRSLRNHFIKSEEFGWVNEDMKKKGDNLMNQQIESLMLLVDIDLEKQRLPKPLIIVKEMMETPVFSEFAYTAYEIFKYYSQYEHFGYMTSAVQKHNFEVDLFRIKQALYIIYKSIHINCLNLGIENSVNGLLEFEQKFQNRS